MFKEAADVKTADTLDLEKLVSHVHEVVAQPSKIQKRLIKSLAKRLARSVTEVLIRKMIICSALPMTAEK